MANFAGTCTSDNKGLLLLLLEALLHYASPNWLAGVMLCLGVASPPLSIKGATQHLYDTQKPLLRATHVQGVMNKGANLLSRGNPLYGE